MEKTLISVGVVSDIVCPWCYIGKHRLQQAMALASDRFAFEVEYIPFELNPHMPTEGADYREYLCRKFGSEERFEALTAHIKRAAARENLVFNTEMQNIYPNTRNAHRVILMARETDKQADVVEALFRAFFTDGIDLSKNENLINIAANSGMDRDRIAALLESDSGKIEIEMAEKELHTLGITSVPLFIINNRSAISGAQSVETFIRAFEETALTPQD